MKKNNSSYNQTTFYIKGMTCTSCEVLIERALQKIPGVQKVQVNHKTGLCQIEHDANQKPQLSTIQKSLAQHHYIVTEDQTTDDLQTVQNKKRNWKEIGVAALIVLALYPLFKVMGTFSGSAGQISDSLTYGAIFLIGIVAALSSCIAVVGGFILSFSTKMQTLHQNATPWQKLKPHLLFNGGRLISYFVLGGVVGALGGVLTPSLRLTGVLTILVAVVMLLLAVDILKIFQGSHFVPKMPKWIGHKLHGLAESNRPGVPLILGGLTFFLPCGFTQAMQLYALTTGSFWQGATIMLVFALGTMPALISVGIIASFSKGTFARYFTSFSGVLVLLLGIYMLSNGLHLLGVQPSAIFAKQTAVSPVTENSNTVVGDKQIVNMAVNDLDYNPSSLTVKVGIPVEWHINAANASGCTSTIALPKMGIFQKLSYTQDTVITFTPTTLGVLPFTCGMGMASGRFQVVE
ncbi:MAG: hypothetical protein A2233_01330 [Candidatus Kerfeldbacteria bacterium RIFOXYA2_FULL_38_24]|uniref:HMA domain-containing protein n=1 Tax=Candidatus Kerfeldbacteria bacterium RIFOXYB2_FULL_38_14 TaxID=1798547 RepID=A0A1G2BGP4_9BACT|nr:MAG: hypothetical protein A2233_01330 [Candidatus Kerfeldbacteria bacterium RIFOXYA2_FULL_38_24]OGY87377.1 MAG: hypothetical protein A2319_05420 [Candidatus Kerfeldbacteria bacterium RIFOXYB2_FULL_38_14]OGY89979.1 MAG: hypothetical protein A2458_05605 [Candidatus Kerfeldbacteria bacterium RIFOXYC2_FULL_38_9]